jgi:hypothetical protein
MYFWPLEPAKAQTVAGRLTAPLQGYIFGRQTRQKRY